MIFRTFPSPPFSIETNKTCLDLRFLIKIQPKLTENFGFLLQNQVRIIDIVKNPYFYWSQNKQALFLNLGSTKNSVKSCYARNVLDTITWQFLSCHYCFCFISLELVVCRLAVSHHAHVSISMFILLDHINSKVYFE